MVRHTEWYEEILADQLLGRLVLSGRVFGITSLAPFHFGKFAIFTTSITGDCRLSSPSLQGEHCHQSISYIRLLTASSLPGTPLWLISVYSSSLAPLTKYWIPAFW